MSDRISKPLAKIIDEAKEALGDILIQAHDEELQRAGSEIERIFYTAFLAATRFTDVEGKNGTQAMNHFPPIGTDLHTLVLTEAMVHSYNLMYEYVLFPQAVIGKYRVDFLIWAYSYEAPIGDDYCPIYDPKYWRKLIVECDGHDFHERTKEQAAKDRSRDRDLSLAGYQVFRFTGSELWRDPMDCARQVIKWGRSV